MEIRQILRLVRKWFWLIILASLLGGAVGMGVSLLQPKVYQTSATLFVNVPNRGDSGSVYGAQQTAKAFAQFPQSTPVLAAALQALDDKSLSLVQLASMITVQNNLDTQFVVIVVRDSDPRRAARLATEIAKQSVAQFRISANDGSNTKDFVQEEIVTLETQIKNLEVELASIQNQTDPNAASTPTPAQIPRINQLNASLSDLRTTYYQLVNSSSNLNSTQVTLLQEAEIPQEPISPRPRVAIAMGMLAGLIIIVGVIFFIEQNDDILHTPSKINQATGLSTLITIENLPVIAKQTPWLNGHHEVDIDIAKQLTAVEKQTSHLESQDMATVDTTVKLPRVTVKPAPMAVEDRKPKDKKINRFQLPEAFLTLGVLLKSEFTETALNGSNMGSLLITSPENGDGKTITAAQIALGIARSGVNVVLVDANWRKPEIHSIFGLSNKVGLSSLLNGSDIGDLDPLSTILFKTPEPHLTILPSGPVASSPIEMLVSQEMMTVLNKLSKTAMVVIDSPAMLTSSESVILADKCDCVLLVVNARRTAVIKLNRTLDLLARIDTKLLGVVLNQAGNEA